MSKTYSKTRILVECALMIALGTVLANIKIFEMPNGGSITLLSMLPFILVSYRHGTKWGLFTGFVNSLLQMLLGFYAPPAPGLLPLVGMILCDCQAVQKPSGRRGRRHGSGVRHPLPVQLPVWRADLGQPERRSARLDLQPDLQRQLHAARDHPDHGGRGADLQGSPAAVCRAGAVRAK